MSVHGASTIPKKAVILHGTEGSPDGNWFRWLQAELEAKGCNVWLPQLPHVDQPSLSEWLDYAQTNAPFALNEDTIIIGHSSGAALALLLAGKSKSKLKTVICVSVFVKECGETPATKWQANAQLFDTPFDWSAIRKHCKNQIIILHSDDDPYIPLAHATRIAKKLAADLYVIPEQGHFNLEKSPAYTKNWYLLRILKNWGYMADALVQVVDENDQPLGLATKHELWQKGLRHRIVRVMLEDNEGRVLLQRRQPYLYPYPGCWDNSAAGHVDAGEEYIVAAKRELNEELGVALDSLELVKEYASHTTYESNVFKRFNRIYRAVIPVGARITQSEREVEVTRWFTVDELRELVESHPEQLSDGLVEAYTYMYKA